jgi:hypothetical protein
VRNPKRRARGVKSATLDGRPLAIERGAVRVPLANDGAGHRIDVVLG